MTTDHRDERTVQGRGATDTSRSELVSVESCTTTWAFDTARNRFARLPRGMSLTGTSAEWKPYASMVVDLTAGTVEVALDEAGTQLLRSEVHNGPCDSCGVVPSAS
jgi:hypothetical protein